MLFVGAGCAVALRNRKVGAGTQKEQHRQTQSRSRMALCYDRAPDWYVQSLDNP